MFQCGEWKICHRVQPTSCICEPGTAAIRRFMIWHPCLFHFLSGTRFLIVVVLCLARHGSLLSLQALNSHFTVFLSSPSPPCWSPTRLLAVSPRLCVLCAPTSLSTFFSFSGSQRSAYTNNYHSSCSYYVMLLHISARREEYIVFIASKFNFFSLTFQPPKAAAAIKTIQTVHALLSVPQTTKWFYFLPWWIIVVNR